MSELNQEKCVACRRDSPHVTQDEINQLLPQVSDWSLVDEDGIRKLDRAFRFADFQTALNFTTAWGNWRKGKDTIPG